MIISRYMYIDIVSRQNKKMNCWFLIVVIISRYIEIISQQNETINFNVPNCRDNKSIY